MNRLRAAAVVALLATQFVLSIDTASAHSYARQRAGIGRWVPTSGWAQASTYPNFAIGLIEWSVRWDDAVAMYELWGEHRAVEFEFAVDGGYADDYDDPEEDYTNVPSIARPYQDTLLFDSPKPGTIARFGFGVADTNFLTSGVDYVAGVGVLHNSAAYLGGEWPASVGMTASTTEEHTGLCNIGGDFNCVFADYGNTSLWRGRIMAKWYDWRSATFQSSVLRNRGFESAGNWWGASAGTYWQSRCDGGYASDCYMRLGTGRVYQVLGEQVPNAQGLVGEFFVRCPYDNSSSCPITVRVTGSGGGIGVPTESRSISFGVPADGNPGYEWYLCRVDEEHGFADLFDWAHDTVMLEIENRSAVGALVDVDYATLGRRTALIDTQSGDLVANPEPGPACTHHALTTG